ncbi:MAG: T9SS type A sorting domain-containing protein [candidate division KSB1 bacterium]|nr:T9SS type A sorting domain-containing protein [candidate division KSB1 bacterium]
MRLFRLSALFFLFLLLIINTAFTQRNITIEPSGHWGGYASCAVVNGQYAYVGQGVTLSVIEVLDGGFRNVSWISVPSEASDMLIHNNHLYVFGGQHMLPELYVINISDPVNPVFLKTVELSGSLYDGCISAWGNYIYAAVEEKVIILDISDPGAAYIAGTLDVQATKIYVTEGYAYILHYGRLSVYDATDPLGLSLLGDTDLSGGLSIDVAGQQAFVGIQDYVSAHSTVTAGTITGLWVVDVSNPQNPEKKGFVETKVEAGGSVNYVRPVELESENNLVYIACEGGFQGEPWFFTTDVTDPENPVIVGDVAINEGLFPGPNSLDISGTHAYISTGASSVSFIAIDISDPAEPQVDSRLEEPWDALYLCTSGMDLYVSSAERLWVYDCSDPEKPLLAGSDNAWPGLTYFCVQGDHLYGIKDSTMVTIDVSDPGNMIEQGRYETNQGFMRRVVISGQVAYILVVGGDSQSFVEIIDITDQQNPSMIGSHPFDGEGRDMMRHSATGHLIVAYDDDAVEQGFVLLDLNDSENPVEIGAATTQGIPICLAASDSLVYVGCNNVGGLDSLWSIESFSVSDATSPTLDKSITGNGHIFDLDVKGQYLFASMPTGSIYVYDSLILTFLKVCPSPSSLYFAMMYFMLRSSWYVFTIDGWYQICSMAVSASWGIFSQIFNYAMSLVSIHVAPLETTVTSGSQVQYKATGYDSLGNEVPTITTWFSTDDGIDSTGLYTAKEPGTFEIVATDSTAGVSGKAYINVTSTAVESETIVPDQYFLSQNYPNPFNPMTTIRFGVRAEGMVLLRLYNVRGREIARIVNEKFIPGTYTVRVDAGELPSGVYFYEVQVNDFRKVKKMVLMQ